MSEEEDGMPRATEQNLCLILRNHPEWEGRLAYDERVGAVVFRKDPPFERPGRGPRVIDVDITELQIWIQEQERWRGLRFGVNMVHRVVDEVAHLSPFDPVREYLEGLEWDGRQRIDDWLVSYLGSPAGEWARAIGPRWLISAVARAFEPGCKADHILVFEGRQCVGKSTALRILAGKDEYFADGVPRLGSRDSKEALVGRWIVELGEIDAMRKAEVEDVQAFLTTQSDRFRASYARRAKEHPRRCVFAATTNASAYLRVATGGRRFWPIRVECVDCEGLRADRDQLWAEAVHRYREGERCHE